MTTAPIERDTDRRTHGWFTRGVAAVLGALLALLGLAMVDPAGAGAQTTLTLGVSEVYSPPEVFTPDGDGNDESTPVYYCLSRNADLTVTVKNAAGTVVRTLESGVSHTGSVWSAPCRYNYVSSFSWDGKNDAGTVVPDGAYTIAIHAVDGDGGVADVTHPVGVNTKAPGVLTSPVAGAVLAGTAAFVFTPAVGVPVTSVSVTCLGSASAASPDGTFRGSADTTSCNAGPTDLRATVQYKDPYGVSHTWTSPKVAVTISNPVRLGVSEVYSPPEVFTPDGDGNDESTPVYYCMSRAANTTIVVKNAAGVVVRTLESGVSRPGSAWVAPCRYNYVSSFSWDGKNDAGVVVPDGAYTIAIHAVDGDGGVPM